MKKAIQPNEYEKWGKFENGTSEEEVIKAVNIVKDYCKSKDCEDCIFHTRKELYGCVLMNPNHIPQSWKIREVTE